MTTADTIRRLLLDAAGDALCDCCLAFACSASLLEVRKITDDLIGLAHFRRSDKCTCCRHTAPAILYSAKCAHCSHPVGPGEDALETSGDILHATCFRILTSGESVRISRKLTRESRRLIEDARRQMREQGKLLDRG